MSETPTGSKDGEDEDSLAEGVLETRNVQRSGGGLTISIPADVVEALELEKGEALTWTGSEGAKELSLQRRKDLLDRDD